MISPALQMVRTLQARKQQFVREAIWDAATDLFAEKGFDETTVEDIAYAAGVSRRSFFRYFSSKSDLMAHGMVNYGAELTKAIDACPRSFSLPEVFRRTVMQVAERAALHPRTGKIIQIGTKYPAARAAELSRLAEVQHQVAEAFSRRRSKRTDDGLTESILAGVTMHVLAVALQSWFDRGQTDISADVEQVFSTLASLMCNGKKANKP